MKSKIHEITKKYQKTLFIVFVLGVLFFSTPFVFADTIGFNSSVPSTLSLYYGSYTGAAISFDGDGGSIQNVQIYLARSLTPPGTFHLEIYSDASGPSTLLASSNNVIASTLVSNNQTLETILFEGINSITLNNGEKYWLAVIYDNSSSTSANSVSLGRCADNTKWPGSMYRYNGSWASYADDFPFLIQTSTGSTGSIDLSETNGLLVDSVTATQEIQSGLSGLIIAMTIVAAAYYLFSVLKWLM